MLARARGPRDDRRVRTSDAGITVADLRARSLAPALVLTALLHLLTGCGEPTTLESEGAGASPGSSEPSAPRSCSSFAGSFGEGALGYATPDEAVQAWADSHNTHAESPLPEDGWEGVIGEPEPGTARYVNEGVKLHLFETSEGSWIVDSGDVCVP